MPKSKAMYATVTDLYDKQGLDVEEIAAVLSISEDVVAEMIADYEMQLDATYGQMH